MLAKEKKYVLTADTSQTRQAQDKSENIYIVLFLKSRRERFKKVSGKNIIIFSILCLVLVSSVSLAMECSDSLKPRINLKNSEELIEDINFYAKVLDKNVSYLNYVEINSSFESFSLDKETNEINFTPSRYDLGEHKLFFYAIDDIDCYSSLLVNMFVYDKPRIIPLKPDSKYILMDEGQGMIFNIEVDDKDNDTKEYVWKINDKKQEGDFKETFAFVTDFNSTGEYNISVIVIDSKKLNDTYTWEIAVREKNREPYLFSELPDYASPVGKKTNIALNNYFGDPDNDRLHFIINATNQKNNNKVDIETVIDASNQAQINTKNFTGVLIVEITAMDGFGGVVKSNKYKLFVVNLRGNAQNNVDNIFCGDNMCNKNESCGTCQKDCGPCTGGNEKCVNRWDCEAWSGCLGNGYMIRSCRDLNGCIDETRKPAEIEECEFKSSCYNKIKDEGETHVDCGGQCGQCPTCTDRTQNQGERGIDCGGPCENICPTCSDKIQNQFESDVDCGGPCEECIDKRKCYSWKDCKSHICKSSICAVATCLDGVKNQDEIGVDCEGVCNNKCPTCFDNILNQNETEVDCGGQCKPCPTCNDNVLNQGEKYTDCGGVCRKCEWGDFEKNNPSKALMVKVALMIAILPFIILILYWLSRKVMKTDKVERLILLNRVFGRRKNVFKNKKEAVEQISSVLKKLEKDIMETNKKETREEIVSMISKFLEKLADIRISNDEETIIKTVKSMEIPFPLSNIVVYIASEAKEISNNKYLTAFEIMSKLKDINLAILEIEKSTQ